MKKIVLLILLPIFFTIKGLAYVGCAIHWPTHSLKPYPSSVYGEEEKEPVYLKPILYMYVREATYYWDNVYGEGIEYIKGYDDLEGVTDETWVFVNEAY